MNSGPLVSVVTPVHNGAEFIEECITSVINQTYTNWVYTIVDNASTDETPEIASRFAAQDSRIEHRRFDDFVSVTDNHNRAFGLAHPQSEYCKVVQGDDWIYPECIERMVEAGETSETIGVVGSYRLNDRMVDLVGFPYSKTFVSGREVLRQSLLGGPYVTGAPTALLLRSKFIREREPFYQPGFWHEDTEAAYWLLSRHDFGYVHQVLTYARRQAGARRETSDRLSTSAPENIRFVLLYGKSVFEPAEYRSRLRLELRTYVRFHVRQLVRPIDAEFLATHRAEIAMILSESEGDREVRAAMSFVTALLSRRSLASLPSRLGAGRGGPGSAARGHEVSR